jgi:hypothetical protein
VCLDKRTGRNSSTSGSAEVGATTTAGAGTGRPDPALLAWCQAVPKVELHLHLEGAIPHPTMLELVRKYDPAGPVTDLGTLVERFRYTDFPHFIEVWTWKHGFLREADDFALIAEAVAADLARQRVRYAEMSFSPHRRRRLRTVGGRAGRRRQDRAGPGGGDRDRADR